MQKKTCRLSAAIMVFNAIETIGRCIDSLSFCDQIIVIDDGSTDGTWEYVKRRNLVAIQHRHQIFSEQRVLGATHASGEWLLTMDADEYITADLAKQITRSIDNTSLDGFFIRRRNPYPKGLSGILWSWHPRLIRTHRCRWYKTDSPHLPPDIRGLKLGRIRKAYMDHEPLPDVVTAWRKALNRNYLLAAQLKARGKRPGAMRLIVSTAARFLKAYFGYGCFKYGRDGLVMASSIALEAYFKYALAITEQVQSDQRLLDGGPGSIPTQSPLASDDRLWE